MAKKIKRQLGEVDTIHCACVIHDVAYDWSYVEKLYNGLTKYLTPQVVMHVYTEADRPVPAPFIHHRLQEWPGLRGPKQSWWYKIQLFNPEHHTGKLLYFDLDTVITGNLDWICQQKPGFFYAVRDFRYLFRPARYTMNSSVMWFDVEQFKDLYYRFQPESVTNPTHIARRFHGDQDYIHATLAPKQLRFFDQTKIRSYKWEIRSGGYNFKTRKPVDPKAPSVIDDVSVLVFHGKPNPHEALDDPVILQYWV